MVNSTRKIGGTGEQFEWIDIHQPTLEKLKEISAQYNLPSAWVQDCLQPDHLPKYERLHDVHFVILRMYDGSKTANATTIQQLSTKLAIFFNDHFFITIHRNATSIISALEEELIANKHNICTHELVAKCIRKVFETFRMPYEKLDKQIDFYESKIFLKKRIPDLLKNLYYLKRNAAVCEKIIYLSNHVITEISAQEKIKNTVVQDLKDEYLSHLSSFSQLNEKMNILLNIYLSVSTQRTNEVMRVLTAFSAIFLPLTFLVGIYGMNFDYMPELTWHWGYFGVLGLMVVLTVIILQWFKRKGWF